MALICILFGCSGGGGGGNSDNSSDNKLNPPALLPDSAETMGAAIREQLVYVKAYEIFGESVMEQYLAEIDQMLAQAYNHTAATAARASSKGDSSRSAGGCEEIGGTFEASGVTYSGTLTTCPNEDQDSIILYFSFATSMTGTADNEGKSLSLSVAMDAKTDKCPTQDGEVTGVALAHYAISASDGKTSTSMQSDAQLNLEGGMWGTPFIFLYLVLPQAPNLHRGRFVPFSTATHHAVTTIFSTAPGASSLAWFC